MDNAITHTRAVPAAELLALLQSLLAHNECVRADDEHYTISEEDEMLMRTFIAKLGGAA